MKFNNFLIFYINKITYKIYIQIYMSRKYVPSRIFIQKKY